MLATGKGWVLPVLAMLAPKGALRVAARGSGPGAKRRRPCPPLCAVAAWRRRDEGRPDHSTPRLRRGSNKGLDRKEDRDSPSSLTLERPTEGSGKPFGGPLGLGWVAEAVAVLEAAGRPPSGSQEAWQRRTRPSALSGPARASEGFLAPVS